MNLNNYYSEGKARVIRDYKMEEYEELKENYIKFKESLNKLCISKRLNEFIKGYFDEAERLLNNHKI